MELIATLFYSLLCGWSIYDQSTSKLYGHIVIMVIITSLTISIEFDIEMWQKTGRLKDRQTAWYTDSNS